MLSAAAVMAKMGDIRLVDYFAKNTNQLYAYFRNGWGF
jgi:hypothetical protein